MPLASRTGIRKDVHINTHGDLPAWLHSDFAHLHRRDTEIYASGDDIHQTSQVSLGSGWKRVAVELRCPREHRRLWPVSLQYPGPKVAFIALFMPPPAQ